MLDVEEAAAKKIHKVERNNIRSKYEAEQIRLATEYKTLRAGIQEALKTLGTKLDQLSRTLFRGRVDARQAERELERYREVTAINYVRLIIMIKRHP